MAKHAVEEIEKKVHIIKLVCLNCGSKKPSVVPNVKTGYGGIKCNHCQKYDNFYSEYDSDGFHYSLVTTHCVDFMGFKTQASYLLFCNNALEVCKFFQQIECSHQMAKNIFALLKISAEPISAYYSVNLTEKEKEEQIAKEFKFSKQLKKILKQK